MKKQNLRSMAAQAVEQVIEQGQSLSNVLPPLQQKVSDKDKALLQELCFGVLRTLSQLEWLINKLMSRPMTGKQRTVHYLIMVGFLSASSYPHPTSCRAGRDGGRCRCD